MQSGCDGAIVHFTIGFQKGANWRSEGLGVIFQLLSYAAAEPLPTCLQVLSRGCALGKNTKHQSNQILLVIIKKEKKEM